MTDVLLVMRLDIAPATVWHFELALDQKIRAIGIGRILLGLEHGLVVVAGDRNGHVVCLKSHGIVLVSRANEGLAAGVPMQNPSAEQLSSYPKESRRETTPARIAAGHHRPRSSSPWCANRLPRRACCSGEDNDPGDRSVDMATTVVAARPQPGRTTRSHSSCVRMDRLASSSIHYRRFDLRRTRV